MGGDDSIPKQVATDSKVLGNRVVRLTPAKPPDEANERNE
jgi:hypothetical protein